MSTFTLEQIDAANIVIKKNAKTNAYTADLNNKYHELAESMNNCDYNYPSIIPDDLASNEFARETECIMGDISKNMHFDLLHELVSIDAKPLKVDQHRGTVVMSGSYPDVGYDLFVIKSQPYENLLTEFIAGYYCLNNLRNDIPNFSLVYGLFNCSAPVTSKSTVGSWCWNKKGSGYIMYEKIQGPTMEDYLVTCTVENAVKCILQVFLAIHHAYKKYGFTHYDLHNDNVIIHHSPEKRNITYPIGNSTVTIETDEIACIIDYGLCHVDYKGLNIGKNRFEHASIFYNKSNPVYDYYRLLVASIHLCLEHNRQDIVGDLMPMFRYLITGPITGLTTLKNINYLPEPFWNTVIDTDTFVTKLSKDYSKYFILGTNLEQQYKTIPYTFPKYDQAYYSYTITNALNNIYDLEYPETFRNVETCSDTLNVADNKLFTETYFDRVVDISYKISKFREALYYTRYIQMNEQLRKSFVYSSKRLSVIMDVIKDDLDKILLSEYYFPDRLSKKFKDTVSHVLIPFSSI